MKVSSFGRPTDSPLDRARRAAGGVLLETFFVCSGNPDSSGFPLASLLPNLWCKASFSGYRSPGLLMIARQSLDCGTPVPLLACSARQSQLLTTKDTKLHETTRTICPRFTQQPISNLTAKPFSWHHENSSVAFHISIPQAITPSQTTRKRKRSLTQIHTCKDAKIIID